MPQMYEDHRQMHPLDALYSGWLAYESRPMNPHLPERVMCQFEIQQVISRDSFVFSPPTMISKDVDALLQKVYTTTPMLPRSLKDYGDISKFRRQ